MVNPTSHTAYALITLAGSLEQARAAYPDVHAALKPTDHMTVAVTGRIPLLPTSTALSSET